MSRILGLLFIALLSTALAACGNKGPLVLPDAAPAQPEKDKDKKAAPAPAAAKSSDSASANGH